MQVFTAFPSSWVVFVSYANYSSTNGKYSNTKHTWLVMQLPECGFFIIPQTLSAHSGQGLQDLLPLFLQTQAIRFLTGLSFAFSC
jgi:hypothetical protein